MVLLLLNGRQHRCLDKFVLRLLHSSRSLGQEQNAGGGGRGKPVPQNQFQPQNRPLNLNNQPQAQRQSSVVQVLPALQQLQQLLSQIQMPNNQAQPMYGAMLPQTYQPSTIPPNTQQLVGQLTAYLAQQNQLRQQQQQFVPNNNFNVELQQAVQQLTQIAQQLQNTIPKTRIRGQFIAGVGKPNNDGKNYGWFCRSCNNLNYNLHTTCKNCLTGTPTHNQKNFLRKRGFWMCIKCKTLNRPVVRTCRNCKGAPAEGQLQAQQRAGIWSCDKCGLKNYANYKTCFNCKTAKPADAKLVVETAQNISGIKADDKTEKKNMAESDNQGSETLSTANEFIVSAEAAKSEDKMTQDNNVDSDSDQNDGSEQFEEQGLTKKAVGQN